MQEAKIAIKLILKKFHKSWKNLSFITQYKKKHNVTVWIQRQLQLRFEARLLDNENEISKST